MGHFVCLQYYDHGLNSYSPERIQSQYGFEQGMSHQEANYFGKEEKGLTRKDTRDITWRFQYQIDCKAGTTAEGKLLANISTSRASLLQGQYLIKYWPWRRLALLVEILANKFCPSAVVPALQSIWFYNT